MSEHKHRWDVYGAYDIRCAGCNEQGIDAVKAEERNRIADALDAESGNYDLADKPSVWVLRFAARLRKGEV